MEFIRKDDRIVAVDENKQEMGYLAWKVLSDGVLNANHTYVDPKFRGMGVAGYLLKDFVAYVRANNKKVFATCSYVVKMFEHGEEYQDIIDPSRGVGDASCEIK